MTWLPRSLRSRITAAVVLLVTVVVGLAGLVIVVRIDHRDRTDVDRQLAARAEKGDQDADKLRDQGGRPSGDEGDGDDYGGLLAGSQSLVRLVSGGKVIAQHGETPTAPLPLPTRDGYRTIDTDGQTWRSLTRSLSTTGERLEVLQDIDPIERRLADNTAIVAAVTLLAALATAGGVWLLTRIILQPLERLRTGALAISADTAGPQLPAVTRPQEVADLSRALTGMLDQLRVSMDSTRRFTADAGHELRTPLTSIGVTLETLQRNPGLPAPQRARALAAMSAEHRRITALLTGLQTLARGDAHALPERPPSHWPNSSTRPSRTRRTATPPPPTGSPPTAPRPCTAGRSACGWPSTTSSTTRRCTAAPTAPWTSGSTGPRTRSGSRSATTVPASPPTNSRR